MFNYVTLINSTNSQYNYIKASFRIGLDLFQTFAACVAFTDRGNDNWLIKYENTPEVQGSVKSDDGVSKYITMGPA